MLNDFAPKHTLHVDVLNYTLITGFKIVFGNVLHCKALTYACVHVVYLAVNCCFIYSMQLGYFEVCFDFMQCLL